MKKKLLTIGSYVLVAMLATVITLALVGENPPSKLDRLEALIENRFIGEADSQTLEDAAAAAMVKATGDRWSYYISAKDYDVHREQEENAYVGVGITIQPQEDESGFLIIMVADGGPAKEAGIEVNDLLIGVEDQEIRGMTTDEAGALVKGEEGIMVKLARCCNPIPGDPVVGYITRGSGVSVHRADCPNVLSNNPEEQSRLIEVSWDVGIDDVYKVNIMITSQDRPGMMSDIMNITSEAKLNIFSLSCHTDKNKMATTHMGLDITSLEQLEYVMNRIRRMKGVYTVERVFATVGGGGKRK